MRLKFAAGLLILIIGAGVFLSLTRKGKNMKNKTVYDVQIYIAYDTLKEPADVAVLIDGAVLEERELQFKGLYPCISELSAELTPGQHEILIRSRKTGNSKPQKFTIKPGGNWLMISPLQSASQSAAACKKGTRYLF